MFTHVKDCSIFKELKHKISNQNIPIQMNLFTIRMSLSQGSFFIQLHAFALGQGQQLMAMKIRRKAKFEINNEKDVTVNLPNLRQTLGRTLLFVRKTLAKLQIKFA